MVTPLANLRSLGSLYTTIKQLQKWLLMKQVSKFLFKNSINITSAVLTFYLLYEDFQLFFSKPTYTSNSESKLQPKNFPSIILCPFPTFDQEELLKIGYEDGYDYAKGKIEGSNLNSWIGITQVHWLRILLTK